MNKDNLLLLDELKAKENEQKNWYPDSIDEMKILIDFYRSQRLSFKDEQKCNESLINSLMISKELKHKMEWDIHNKTKDNKELKQQLSDTHYLLYQEKQKQLELKSEYELLQRKYIYMNVFLNIYCIFYYSKK